MKKLLRKLNEQGVMQFKAYIAGGAVGPAPVHLLDGAETSEPLQHAINIDVASFQDRYEFGKYLVERLQPLEKSGLSSDRFVWTWLALLWFDELCPLRADGTRDVKQDHRYIFENDFRHYYRHLVRSPWYIVRQHGVDGRFLLLTGKEGKYPLSVHGEILEQIGSRQHVFGSRKIVAAASRLYADAVTGRPKRGVAGRGPGSAFRFGTVLRQFDLTYEPEMMTPDALVQLFPAEFDHWKKAPPPSGKAKTSGAGVSVAAS